MSRLEPLWERMLGMYGHAWASQNGTTPSGVTAETWGAALAGLDRLQLAAGLRACVVEGREFPPSAPRFRAMCLGIPPFERVRIEVTQPDADRSPFTRAAWMHVDGYRYRHASAQDADRMLRAAYDIAHDLVMQGHSLPEPSLAIAAPEPLIPQGIPATREARIAHLQALLGEDFNPAATDPNYDPARARQQRERDELLAQLERGKANPTEPVDVDLDEEDAPWA